MRYVLGVDGAQASFKACLRSGEKIKTKSFASTETGFKELANWLYDNKAELVHVCMEATGRYNEPLAYWLTKHGYKVSVVNAKAIKAHGASQMKRSKTDRVDAILLADYCWKNDPPEWSKPSDVRLKLRDVNIYIAGLKKTMVAQKQRLKCGIIYDQIKLRLEQDIDRLEEEIEQMYELAEKLIESDKDLCEQRKILHTIFAIKKKTSAILLTKIDFQSFRNGRNVGCFAGLTPRKHESGESICYRGRISKMGDSDIRRALYLPACNAMRNDPAMRAFAERLTARGKPYQVVATAVMRKMLSVAWTVIKKNEPYDYSRLLRTA